MKRLELKKQIGKVGVFYNNVEEKSIKIGRLKSVKENGYCEDEDGDCYKNFTVMNRSKLLEFIDLELFS
jgi:hypothetical protein